MLRLGSKSVCSILLVIIILLATTNTVFALQQLTNPTFNGDNGWTTHGRVNGNTAATVNYHQNNLEITASRSGNARTYDNLVLQQFRTPANPINVRFSWGAWNATSANTTTSAWYTKTITNQNYRLVYGTTNNNENGTELSSRNSDGNNEAGTSTVTNLPQNQTYYAKIYCSANISYKSYTISFSSFEVNFSPSGLAANLNFSSNGVTLNWNTSTSNAVTLSKYYIYRSKTSGSGYTKIGEVNAGTTTYLDTSVFGGSTYYYVITDVDTNGIESPYSKEINILYPPSPRNLTVNINASNNVFLTWEAPSPTNAGHNGYAILRATSSSGPFTTIGTVTGNNLNYTDTSITISNGDSYFYVIADINASSNFISGYSNVASVNLLAPPTRLTATQTNGAIILNWTATTCPLAKLGGYYIYRSNSPNGPFTKIGTVGNVLTYTDSTAEAGITWYYVVSAYNKTNGESDYSNKANSLIPSVSLNVSIDSSVAPEIVRPVGITAEIPVNWEVNPIGSGLTITKYTVTIYKSNGTSVRSGSTSNSSATSYTVSNFPLENGQSYYATVEVSYKIGTATKNKVFISTNSFMAITPKTISVIDGWSGKDIEYSFFDNRVEACWEHDEDSAVVRYEIAVGTTQYGTDLADWQDIGLTKRISLTTPGLASGTKYYTSVRGITQKKSQAVMGCSNGFIARKDPVTKDTDALNFFNNARVLENLSTDNGKLTPSGEIANGNWKYYRSVTITEPGIIDRVNAPCLVNFTIPAAQRPANIREFRVVDD
ncbi:MAG: hypothetical protein J6Z11_04745, partial [Candidatus Riflebacteria bacterium]|nr:hypothetical protein [Candidatus Riflebacteria bacterium]